MGDGRERSVFQASSGAALALTGTAAVVLLGLVLALEDQLARLRAPTGDRHRYAALHGTDVRSAFDDWDAGVRALAPFGPRDAPWMVRLHVAVDSAFVGATVLFLVLLVLRATARRRGARPWLVGAVLAGGIAGLAANLLECRLAGLRDGGYRSWFVVLLVIEAATATATVGTLLWHERHRWRDVRAAYQAAPATARIVAFVAVGFGLLVHFGDIGAQAEDLLRRSFEDPGDLWGIVGGLAFYELVVAALRRLRIPPGRPPKAATLLVLGGVAATAGALVVAGGGQAGLLALGVVLLAVGAASLGTGRTAPPPPPSGEVRRAVAAVVAVGVLSRLRPRAPVVRPEPEPRLEEHRLEEPGTERWIWAVAAAAPPTALGLLAGRLAAGEWATTAGAPAAALGLAAALVTTAVIAGWVAHARIPQPQSASRRSRIGEYGCIRSCLLLLGTCVPGAVAVGTLLDDDFAAGIGESIGGIGVLLVGLGALGAGGGLARLLLADWEVPRAFSRLGCRSTPVTALLLAWFLLATGGLAWLERAGASPHVTRSLPLTGPAPACPDDDLWGALDADSHEEQVAVELCRWLDDNARGAGPTPVPLVLVTASGGGVRAAVFTARVLDCLLLDPGSRQCPDIEARTGSDRWPALFAAGGTSGGSVGVASAVAQRLSSGRGDWVGGLDDDHVGPVLAHAVLAELALAPTGVVNEHDRAEVLIDGWTDEFGSVDRGRCDDERVAGRTLGALGFRQLRRACPAEVPLLLFNGTAVSGQRFNISPLDGSSVGPPEASFSWTSGSIDLRDALCDDGDIPFFDAAFLSARFPLVTPSAHFGDERSCRTRQVRSVDVVDGGYVENSGAAQVGELWSVLGPLLDRYEASALVETGAFGEVAPILVRIENGERPPGQPWEPPDLGSPLAEPLNIPVAWLRGQLGSRDAGAIDELLAQLDRDGVPVVDLALYEHPGRRLPLGWALTDQIVDDIDAAMQLDPNRCAAERFAQLLARPDLDPDRC